MSGETNINQLLQNANPILNEGEYVFVVVSEISGINRNDTILEFKEKEGVTAIMLREKADKYNLKYDQTYAWIIMEVHSSLEAVGFTAAFATKLSKAEISCNVVAAFYHDHIFVKNEDSNRALKVLQSL